MPRSLPFPCRVFAPLFAVVLAVASSAHAAPTSLDVALSEEAAQRAAQVSNAAPVFGSVLDMTLNAGDTADQVIQATDSDGNPLTFSKASGPAYLTVTTTSPGTGTGVGNIHVAPSQSDDGISPASVAAFDGFVTVHATFSVTVIGPNDPPLLLQPADITVAAGTSSSRELQASDPDGDPLTFSLVSGPAYASVQTADPGMGTAFGSLSLSPPLSTPEGQSPATVRVSDGTLSDEKSLTITISGRFNRAPILGQPPDVSIRVGHTDDSQLSATDADHDPLFFSKASGPTFVTVTTISSGTGFATGRMLIAPAAANVGSFSATVQVSDGLLTDSKSFDITVTPNQTPQIFIGSMTVNAGETATQYFNAYDNDGDTVTLTKVSGPAYMAVSTVITQPYFSQGRIDLSPALNDVGSATGQVAASDGVATQVATFSILVRPPNTPPTLEQPADMVATEGRIAEQTVHATDPDGSTSLSIFKLSGPDYMTVSQFQYGNPAAATIRITPGVGTVGSTTGTVRVTDGYGGSDSKTFNITISAGNFPAPCPANTFVSGPAATTGLTPYKVAAADLNYDDVPDLVTTNLDGYSISVLLGQGNGSFSPKTDYDMGGYAAGVAIGDLNLDGIPDLAVSSYSFHRISIFLGDGAGGFGARKDFNVTGYPIDVAIADFEKDGKPDIVTSDSDSGVIQVLRGNGDGTFAAPRTTTTGSYIQSIAVGDLTGDGAPEIVAAQPNLTRVVILINDGSGLFAVTERQLPDYPAEVELADMNGDTKLDLVVPENLGVVAVLLGSGNGTFEANARRFSGPYYPTDMAVADFNGDHLPDVNVAGGNSSEISLFLGDGTGNLGPRTIIATNQYGYGLAAADFDLDTRNDFAFVNYSNSSALPFLNRGCAPQGDRPPRLTAPRSVAGIEAALITFQVSATDPDGDLIADLEADFSGLPVGHDAALSKNANNTIGTFTWTPTYAHGRPAPYKVTFTALNGLATSKSTQITVANVNRRPAANAGGPYTAFVDAPLQLDGSGSADPDGDALMYAWVFGDGATGMGAQPQHTYRNPGVYAIALSVSDGNLGAITTTTATISGVFDARAFTSSGNKLIRLTAGKPQWCVGIEPLGGSFRQPEVDLRSVVMRSTGTGSVDVIHAILEKTVVGSDHDGNGVEEITACFSKDDLRSLFSNLHGKTTATVTIEGAVYTGGVFRAMIDVGVQAGGGGNLSASLSPNPLNPSAVLTFVTSQPGRTRITLFDLNGRLVRMVRDEAWSPAGYHDVTIDGRNEGGGRLASGVYFYRIETADGDGRGRFTVLK